MSRLRIVILALSLVLGISIAAGLSACGGDGAGSPSATPAASSSGDPIVLRVDGRAVHKSTVDAVRAEFRLGRGNDTRARAEEEVVRRELLRREAERLGVKADPAAVQARRDALVQQSGGEQALQQVLVGVSMTEAQLQSGLVDGVMHEALENAKFEGLSATLADARAYYDGHRKSFREQASAHLYAISVRSEGIARSALTRLREGRSFAEVARQFSLDAEAKDNGGDLGVVAIDALPRPFVKALDAAKEDAVVGPVQGPGGWFVLKATDMKPARVIPFSEVRSDIVKELTRRDRYRALEKWLDAARERASVTRP